MDTERPAEFVSTLVIIGAIAFLVLTRFGVEDLALRLGYSLAIAVVGFGPVVWYLVYRAETESYMFGPWGPEDVVFLAVVTPLLLGVVWVADTYLAGVLYYVVVLVGLFVSIGLAVVARSLTIGEWPPGSSTREAREGGPPGR